MNSYDAIVIGGGPGGYTAAIRLFQLGCKTALVEREALGGVCLNWGCIPTKSLIKNAEVAETLRQGEAYGFTLPGGFTLDYHKAWLRSREVSTKLCRGVTGLMKKNNVDVIAGEASFVSPDTLEVKGTGRRLTAKNIIIATGSRPNTPEVADYSDPRIITARGALALEEAPKSVVIIGAGSIGMEFAHIWRAYGAEVTLIEMLPALLPTAEPEVSESLTKAYTARGIIFHAGTKVENVKSGSESVTVTARSPSGNALTINCGHVLISAGIRPNTEGLALERAGVQTEKGYIVTDDHMRTSARSIYAIGDVTGKLALAHAASAQGLHAAELICGGLPPVLDHRNMPKCTYSIPEAASVGYLEKEAREAGHELKIGRFPFMANGKAIALDEPDGFVKVISDASTGEILGASIVGPHATELISECAAIIGLEGDAETVARITHPHPSLSESVAEAIHAAFDRPINF